MHQCSDETPALAVYYADLYSSSAGRARRGPAPLNLEIPEYEFENDAEEKLIIG